MSSTCVSKCVTDARVPSSANYVSLSKWPEYSDAKFPGAGRKQHTWNPMHTATCSRQVYLGNGYSFSRKETVPAEKTRTYFGKVRETVVPNMTGRRLTRQFQPQYQRRRKTKVELVKKVKEFSCEAFCSIFQKLLSCTATVDVVEQNDHIIRQHNN